VDRFWRLRFVGEGDSRLDLEGRIDLVPDLLLEGLALLGRNSGGPTPGLDFRDQVEVLHIHPEFLRGDVLAALKESAQAFQFVVADAMKRLANVVGFHSREGPKGIRLLAGVDLVGQPDRCQGQREAGSGGEHGCVKKA